MTVAAPQQKRSEATLARILDACDALSRERGFDELSMQEIARTAGVSVGNLYNRFSNKDGLIDHLIRRRQQEVVARIAALLEAGADGLDLRARLEAVTQGFAEGTADLRPLLANAARRAAAGGDAADAEVKKGGEAMVDGMALWVHSADPGLDLEDCRFAVASIAYALQFNALFGAPARMFGDSLNKRLVDQAFAYLTSDTH